VPDVDKLPAIAAPPALTVKPCWKVVKPEMSTCAHVARMECHQRQTGTLNTPHKPHGTTIEFTGHPGIKRAKVTVPHHTYTCDIDGGGLLKQQKLAAAGTRWECGGKQCTREQGIRRRCLEDKLTGGIC
jgi:hypothetical protein